MVACGCSDMGKRAGLENGIWVLVCDRRKALLMQNEGDRTYPKLRLREVSEHADRPSHELGTDVPGRTFSGSAGRHSAIQPKDLQRLSEESFLNNVAVNLDRRVKSGEIGSLILVASTRALGAMRQSLSASVRRVIRAEIERDLVRMPIYEIERHILALLQEQIV